MCRPKSGTTHTHTQTLARRYWHRRYAFGHIITQHRIALHGRESVPIADFASGTGIGRQAGEIMYNSTCIFYTFIYGVKQQ